MYEAHTKPKAKNKRKRRARPFEAALLSVAVAILLALCLVAGAFFGLSGTVASLFATSGVRSNPPSGTYSIISVEGTIQASNSSGYRHDATVQFIKKLQTDEGNLGILLNLNTGGGGVYESDEVYRALMDYKDTTGRPVWAYMGRTCASGGYYIAMAADHIIANHNTTTGSIGVYYQLTDTSGLYEKLGIETVLVRSGDNKGIGIDGVEITERQRAVYQSMVDESYERFVEIIVAGRGLKEREVLTAADGRPYTALQAQALGLVDELGDYDYAKEAFTKLVGGEGYNTSFAATSGWSALLAELPKGEAQALVELASEEPEGTLQMRMEGLF